MNKTKKPWEIITRLWGKQIEDEFDIHPDILEAAVIEEAFRTYFTYGSLQDTSYDGENVDWTATENLLHELEMADLYLEDTDIPGYEDGAWLSYWISDLIWKLRNTFLRMFGNLTIKVLNGNLATVSLVEAKAIMWEDDVWRLQTSCNSIDSGLIAAPTLSEFKTLMYYWQEMFGSKVGQVKNYDGDYGIYIGRNRHLFEYNGPSGIRNSAVPMGNPFSSKSNRHYNIVTEDGPFDVLVKDKLSACYAFYLAKVDRLIQFGLDDGDDHWTHLIELHDSELICHCGDFTNQRDSSKFCHGLVLSGLTELFYPYTG